MRPEQLLFPLDPEAPSYGYQPVDRHATPAVSVITPYYDTGPIFLETATSLLRQSLQQWQWIIVNDGSTDPQSLQTLLPFRQGDPRIQVIDTPNRGLSAARNTGIAASQAPLIFLLDSDDLLAPTTLEQLAWTLHSHPASAFATSWTVSFGAEHVAWPLGFNTRRAFLYQNMATALTMLRREVFAAVGGFEEQRRNGLEDYEFWLRCAANGYWGHDLRQYLIWVRKKAAAEYTSYTWAARDDLHAYRAFRNEMRQRFPKLYREGLPILPGNGGLYQTHALINPHLPFENQLQPVGKRRILLLCWVQVGGADRFALDLVAGLVASGDKVTVGLTREDAEHTWLPELLRTTPDVFRLPNFLRSADLPRFLVYLIKSRQIDTVLICNSLISYQLLPFLRAHCPAVAFVDYLHMEQEERRSGGFPRAAIEHEALLDLHITSSNYLKNWMQKRGSNPERIEVCTTNIDTNHWQPDPVLRQQVRDELGLSPEMPFILIVGRLVPQKRPLFSAKLLQQLQHEGILFRAAFAGDGSDMRALAWFLRQNKLTQVQMLGAVPHQRIRELLAAADLFLLPSAQEGLSLALFEALAMGVVPIAAASGGQAELVSADCGFLIAPGATEEAEYLAALRQMLTNQQQRAQLAANGRARVVAHFGLQQMISEMRALFGQAEELAQHHPRPPIDPGVALAVATLAIEHLQLEDRLRATIPVRLGLKLRWSTAWPLIARLAHFRSIASSTDRAIYEARREIMRALRMAAAWLRSITKGSA